MLTGTLADFVSKPIAIRSCYWCGQSTNVKNVGTDFNVWVHAECHHKELESMKVSLSRSKVRIFDGVSQERDTFQEAVDDIEGYFLRRLPCQNS